MSIESKIFETMGCHLFGLMLESIYSIAGNKAPQELENGNTVFLSYREQKICNCLFFSVLQYGVLAWNEQSERQGMLNSDKNRPPGYFSAFPLLAGSL